MNKSQAEKKGYKFFGSYSQNYGLVKEALLECTKGALEGFPYEVVIVTIPTDSLSRGNKAPGYALYVTERYTIEKEIEKIDRKKAYLEQRYREEVKELDQRKSELLTSLSLYSKKRR